MPLTVDLPDDLATALSAEAERRGLSLAEYALRLLTSAQPAAPTVRNGTDLLAFWRAAGVIGTRSDLGDSSVEARRLREQAQRRGS